MGVIRGILFVFLAVSLFFFFVVGNVLWTLNLSLDYENVKSELGNVLDNIFEDQNLDLFIDDNLGVMELYCETNSEYVVDYGDGNNLVLPCSVILEGSDAVGNYVANEFVEDFYYKNYDCDFVNCLETVGPFFLISEKAKDYWNSKAYFFLIGSLILIASLFVLAEKKSNTFIVAGSLLIVASLPFSKLDLILNLSSDKLVLGMLKIFFSEAYTVFIVSIIIGIVLLVAGILLKVFGIGFGISNFFSKFSKKKPEGEKQVSEKKVKPVLKQKKKPVKKSKSKKFRLFGFMKKKSK